MLERKGMHVIFQKRAKKGLFGRILKTQSPSPIITLLKLSLFLYLVSFRNKYKKIYSSAYNSIILHLGAVALFQVEQCYFEVKINLKLQPRRHTDTVIFTSIHLMYVMICFSCRKLKKTIVSENFFQI